MCAAIATDPDDYQTFRAAYSKWRDFLEAGRSPSAAVFQTFYEDHIETPFARHPRLAKAIFDEDVFPSLFSTLPIHPTAGVPAIEIDALPREWNPHFISAQLAGNPLARFLLAFIWKQGDFDKVKHMLSGFGGKGGDHAVVLVQFGRYLKSPLAQPIFDQHTSRHFMLYERFSHATPHRQYRLFFGKKRGLIPTTQAALTKPARLKDFLKWWTEKLGNPPRGRLPALEDAPERGEAILWADRAMFSLGKAAALVQPEPSLEDKLRSQ